jgi:CheY-like chemotaxis protein
MTKFPQTLIVDDEHLNRMLLARCLQSFNITYSETTDGQEALDWIKKSTEKQLILLLDLNMPIMDGYELMAYLEINASEFSDKQIEIIIVSAASQSSFENLISLANINLKIASYIEKPVSKNRLYDSLVIANNNFTSPL